MTWAIFLVLVGILVGLVAPVPAAPLLVVYTYSLAVSLGKVLGPGFSQFEDLAFKYLAAFQGLCFFALALLAMQPRTLLHGLKILFIFVACVDSLYVLYQYVLLGHTGYESGGFLGNASMNACFLAVLLPQVLDFTAPGVWRWLWGLTLSLAIFMSNSSMGVGVLLVVLGLLALFFTKKWWVLFLTPVPVAISATAFMNLHEIFSTSNRLSLWQIAFKYWEQQVPSQFFGFGPGTSAYLLPHIQAINNWQQIKGIYTVYPTMHNDWLQILFELGWLGLVASVILAVYLLWKNRRSAPLFVTIVAVILVMCGNYPLHSPLFALLVAVVVGLGLTDDTTIEDIEKPGLELCDQCGLSFLEEELREIQKNKS